MRSSGKQPKEKKPASHRPAIDLFAEAGLLKHIKRSGWWVAGIKEPESVAEHCFRCAVMAYYLAHREGADPYRAMAMALFNDIHEARINDLHKMGHYYIDFKKAESKVFKDQVAGLQTAVKEELSGFRGEYEDQKSPEALVARDADILECLLQAKEYYDSGYLKAKKFFKQAPDHLHTAAAKELWNEIKDYDTSAWWERVVKFER
jgi:putative hydrolase of HD superfamily